MTPGPATTPAQPHEENVEKKMTRSQSSALNRKLWAGRKMPLILLGSREHNKALSEERAKQALATQALFAEAEKYLQQGRSALYCNETLDELSPQKPLTPQSKLPPLSPFSLAKQTASNNGVSLSDDKRVALLAHENKNKKQKHS